MWSMKTKLLLSLILLPVLCLAQFSLKGKFTPVDEFDWVLVYRITPTNNDYIGDAKIDAAGNFQFNVDAKHAPGMYRLVYAVPEDQYNFDIIYNGKEDVEFTYDINKGIQYQASTENVMMTSYNNSMGMISQSIGNYYRSQSSDVSAFMSLLKTQRETQEEYERISEGMIVNNFIKANRPFIAEGYQDLNTYFGNIKAHYFDNVDFNNETLLSSNFLVDRCLNYVFGMVSRQGDIGSYYKSNIDQVANAMNSASSKTRKMLMHVIWQQLADAKFEGVANYVADNYLISLASELGENELVVELERFRNLSLGRTAPNFDLGNSGKDSKSITLHDYNVADEYVVVFWSSTCAHCLEELPKLHDYVGKYRKDKTKVIAFGLEDEEALWRAKILRFPLFEHTIGLGKWENKVGNDYNVTSTPTYYVLDKNKTIVGKPMNFEDLQKFFTAQK